MIPLVNDCVSFDFTIIPVCLFLINSDKPPASEQSIGYLAAIASKTATGKPSESEG